MEKYAEGSMSIREYIECSRHVLMISMYLFCPKMFALSHAILETCLSQTPDVSLGIVYTLMTRNALIWYWLRQKQTSEAGVHRCA